MNAELAAKNQRQEDEISELRTQIAQLAKQVQGEKRGPGRPRKVEAA